MSTNQNSTEMNKKLKENVKRIVGEGLSLIMNKLKISKPSAKMEKSLKRHSRKLVDHLKAEIKRQSQKKGSPGVRKGRVTKVASKKKP
jgi:hypothetical protein